MPDKNAAVNPRERRIKRVLESLASDVHNWIEDIERGRDLDFPTITARLHAADEQLRRYEVRLAREAQP